MAEFPQGTWHRSCPQHWSLLENQESSQIHRVPTPNGLHFHCKRKQFWFLSVLPWAATPLGRSPGPGLQPMGMLASVAHRLPNITKAGAFVYQRVGSVGTAPLPRQRSLFLQRLACPFHSPTPVLIIPRLGGLLLWLGPPRSRPLVVVSTEGSWPRGHGLRWWLSWRVDWWLSPGWTGTC